MNFFAFFMFYTGLAPQRSPNVCKMNALSQKKDGGTDQNRQTAGDTIEELGGCTIGKEGGQTGKEQGGEDTDGKTKRVGSTVNDEVADGSRRNKPKVFFKTARASPCPTISSLVPLYACVKLETNCSFL